jgi:hypothetical protein
MNDRTYAEIMKKKRAAATRNGIVIGGIAVAFFLFPLVFTAWKNSQGSEGMLVNKTLSAPGQKSTPIYQYEQKHGRFSSLTDAQAEAQFNGMVNKPSTINVELSPQEQYQQYKQQQQQQNYNAKV